jgi:DNA helicase HerA-like ATPase
MYKGRIIGKSVTEIVFRSYYAEELFLGDILVAEDRERGLRFLLRVVDVKYGVEAADPEWTSRTAGNMMLMDSHNQTFELYDKDRRLFKLGECVPLGYVKERKFHKPKTIPSHFSCITPPSVEDFRFLKEYMGDIVVGKLRSGEDTLDFEVGIKGELFPYHVGIFATTGMGKSNLMKVLSGAVVENGNYALLLIDPHGEYYDGGGKAGSKGLRDLPEAAERLRIYSSRELSGAHNTLKLSFNEITLSDLAQIYTFSEPQYEAASAAEYRFGKEWLKALASNEVADLVDALPGKFFEATLTVLQRRAESILRLSSVHGDPKVSVTSSILHDLKSGKVVLVDASNMTSMEELLISSVLCRALFEHNKTAYRDIKKFAEVLPTLIVIEEAQRVLGKDNIPASSVFAQIAREGRKFKTGLCAVTQQPKLIDEELLSQFNTLFILGLADEKDRSILRNSAKQDISQLGNEIQTLMAGEALISSPETPFAVPAKIHLFEQWLKSREQSATGKEKELSVQVDKGFF